MIKKILISLDDSERSQTATRYGTYLSKIYDATATGLHVINSKVLRGYYYVDASLALGYVGDVKDMIPIEEAMQKKGEQILDKFRSAFEEEGLKPETVIIKGIVDDVIVTKGKEHDLIVISQTGEHAHFIKGLLGSTTEPVLHKSDTTVLVTPENFKEVKNTFIAYDGSNGAGRALNFACSYCKHLDIPLAVLIVEDDPNRGKQLGRAAADICKTGDIEPELVIIPGYAEEEILKFAKIRKMDLAFLGSHGHTRLREFIIGSTTLYVTRNTEIPVFVVR